MNIYQFNNYREILHESLLAKKARYGREFTFEKMAKACRLQRSYLSTVLSGNGHLNADQVYDAASFLEFEQEEYRYVNALHEYERSVSPQRKLVLRREIDELKAKALQAEDHLESESIVRDENLNVVDFYCDIDAQLIHMFLTVKRLAKDLEGIRRILGLDPFIFSAALRKIEKAGLIRIHGKAIEVLKENFHLPSTSPLFPVYRSAMRLRAMEMMQKRSRSDHYSFSVLYSADAATQAKIQAKFLEFVDWAQQLTQGTEPTDVFQLNFDLLRWSQS